MARGRQLAWQLDEHEWRPGSRQVNPTGLMIARFPRETARNTHFTPLAPEQLKRIYSSDVR